MAERFYVNSPLALGPVWLPEAEARHLATVCRLRPGDRVCLFNGNGLEYLAAVKSVAKREVVCEIDSQHHPVRELPIALEIAAALPKGDRAQFMIEKLTELGVTRFVPLLCERGVVLPKEGKADKLRRYVIEASKQCGRNVLLEIAAPARLQEYLVGGVAGWLAHPSAMPSPSKPCPGAVPIRIAIGPEGGFTEAEVANAQAQGWHFLDLGPRILRIETAALAAALWAQRRPREL